MKSHDARLIAMRIVAPAKRNVLSIESQQAMIRDGNAVRVAAEVTEYLKWSAESRLGINNPVLATQTSYQLGKLPGFSEYGRGSGAAELVAAIQAFQTVDELAAEQTT